MAASRSCLVDAGAPKVVLDHLPRLTKRWLENLHQKGGVTSPLRAEISGVAHAVLERGSKHYAASPVFAVSPRPKRPLSPLALSAAPSERQPKRRLDDLFEEAGTGRYWDVATERRRIEESKARVAHWQLAPPPTDAGIDILKDVLYRPRGIEV